MVILKQACKRIYRYWCPKEMAMSYPLEFEYVSTFFHYAMGSEKTLMEGTEIDGKKFYEGDVFENESKMKCVLEIGKLGEYYFIFKNPAGYLTIDKYDVLKKIGNVFENPGLWEVKKMNESEIKCKECGRDIQKKFRVMYRIVLYQELKIKAENGSDIKEFRKPELPLKLGGWNPGTDFGVEIDYIEEIKGG